MVESYLRANKMFVDHSQVLYVEQKLIIQYNHIVLPKVCLGCRLKLKEYILLI
jgi:hypothetical protein